MIEQLLAKIEEGDSSGIEGLLKDKMSRKGEAWAIHLSLFPLVQRVINPPFINPHLPKMYRIYREFLPYLTEEDIPPLVRLEINEYARRPRLEELPKLSRRLPAISLSQIGEAVRAGGQEEVAVLLNVFLEDKGKAELARSLLLLGSGYMDKTLGHSVSCTGFILLEMLERVEQDPWPALAVLADYFCKGGFHSVPAQRAKVIPSQEALDGHLLRASCGNGIVNLHHTITRYSIERVRHLLSEAEYAHMIACWIDFLGDKSTEMARTVSSAQTMSGYDTFFRHFSKRDEEAVLPFLMAMASSEEGCQQLGRYLIKGICDLYQGNYDPHFLTGLGSALWVVNRHWDRPAIVFNTLRQYLNYFFTQVVY